MRTFSRRSTFLYDELLTVFQDTKIAAAKNDFISYKMAKGASKLLTQLRNKKILTSNLKNIYCISIPPVHLFPILDFFERKQS